MADIFISYKREERRSAEALSIALEQLGFDVWWDFELLSGDRYRKVIRAVIDQCAAAIVLWSARAVDSDFVVDEASYAKSQGKLCPARIDDVDLPFGFGSIHTDDLTQWEGELSHPGFQSLVRALEARIGRKAKLGAAPRSREAQAAAAELESFKAAQIANNPSALRTFLRDHPRGAFAAFVRGQLDTMEANAPRERAGTAQGPDRFYEPPPPPPRQTWSEPAPQAATPAGPPPRKPPWPLILGGAGALLAALGVVVFLNLQQEARDLAERRAFLEEQEAGRERQARVAAEARARDFEAKATAERAGRMRALALRFVGDWRKVSGTSCARGYRLRMSGETLTRAYASGSAWGSPRAATGFVNDNTVAFGSTQLRLSQDRLYVSNPNWSSNCRFERGAPTSDSSSSSSSSASSTRSPSTSASSSPTSSSAASSSSSSSTRFSLSQLHASVRRAAEAARAAQTRAFSAARRARSAASTAETAARNARNGTTGHRAYDAQNDAQRRRYEGGWSNGARNGYGVYYWRAGTHAGDRFAGRYAAGERTLGVYYYADRSSSDTTAMLRYEGEWSGGQYGGSGVIRWRRGDRYAGEFADDDMEGYGVYTFASGARYEGQRVDDKRHGYGVEWSSTGQVRRAGRWTNGSLTTSLTR